MMSPHPTAGAEQDGLDLDVGPDREVGPELDAAASHRWEWPGFLELLAYALCVMLLISGVFRVALSALRPRVRVKRLAGVVQRAAVQAAEDAQRVAGEVADAALPPPDAASHQVDVLP